MATVKMVEVECPNGMRPLFETQEDAAKFARGYLKRWPDWNDKWVSRAHPFTFHIREINTSDIPEDFSINEIMDLA